MDGPTATQLPLTAVILEGEKRKLSGRVHTPHLRSAAGGLGRCAPTCLEFLALPQPGTDDRTFVDRNQPDVRHHLRAVNPRSCSQAPGFGPCVGPGPGCCQLLRLAWPMLIAHSLLGLDRPVCC